MAIAIITSVIMIAFLANLHPLLDEPTSNLDGLNEAMIMKSLKAVAKEKAVLMVSHRDSAIRAADIAYEMKNGKLAKCQ